MTLNPGNTGVKRDPTQIAIDRLGDLVDTMHDTARAQKRHNHGDFEATRKAADMISEYRKTLQRGQELYEARYGDG